MTDRNITRSCKAVQPSKRKQSVFVGDEFTIKQGCKAKVIEYKNKDNVLIEFQDKHKCRMYVSAHHLRTGSVKNPYHPNTCGVGYIGVGSFTASVNRKHTPEYSAWTNMMKRCYSDKYQRRNPTYIGCTVCDEWHNFQNFAEWYTKQKNYNTGCDLDKDLLVKNNKIYSPQTCSLVPKAINYLLLKKTSNTNNLPCGVHLCENGSFKATMNQRGISKHIGVFKNTIDASTAYQKEKKNYIKEIALEWKDRIDERLFNTLMQRAM